MSRFNYRTDVWSFLAKFRNRKDWIPFGGICADSRGEARALLAEIIQQPKYGHYWKRKDGTIRWSRFKCVKFTVKK